MVKKVCAAPNCDNVFDGHGNAKYCSPWCKNKVRREQNRLKQQRYRDRQNQGTLLRNQIGNAALPHQTALEVYQQEAQEELLIRILQKGMAPLIFEVNQRLIELNHRQASFDTELQELKKVLPLSPHIIQEYPWRAQAIQKAMALLQELEGHLALYKIRKILEDALRMDKRTAELILKQAREQLQKQGDYWQKRLDDFEDDLGGN